MYYTMPDKKHPSCAVLVRQMNVGHSFSHPNMVEHTNNSPSFAHIQPQRPVHMQYGVTHNLDFLQPAADMNIRRVNGNQVPFHRTPMETFDVGQAQVAIRFNVALVVGPQALRSERFLVIFYAES